MLSPILISSSIMSPLLSTIDYSDYKIRNDSIFISPIITNPDPGTIYPPMKLNVKSMTAPITSMYPLINPTGLLLVEDIFVPSINLFPKVPMTTTYLNPWGIYGDSCDIENIKEQVSKMFYYKFLDKWLFDNDKSKYLLGYLRVSGDKVELVSDTNKLDDYEKNSKDVIEKKVDYFEKKLISKDDVYLILKKFVEGTKVSWCDLQKNSYFIRESIEKTMENQLKRLIKKN